jgi:hypothetical protein
MIAMVRAQSALGYRELVRDLGGNPTRLLRLAGIDPAAPNQLTAFVSFESLIGLMERSAAELDCPDFGLRLPERQDIGILDTLSVAMRYSRHRRRRHGVCLPVLPGPQRRHRLHHQHRGASRSGSLGLHRRGGTRR